MSRFSLLFIALVAFASFSTLAFLADISSSSLPGLAADNPTFSLTKVLSPVLFPTGWFLVGLAWIWRGRIKSRWQQMGLNSESFRLLVRMKGGITRLSILKTLESPKDRLQIANELGLDWKTVDRHVRVLNEFGLIKETSTYGNIVLFGLTKQGEILLQLMDELQERT